MTARISSARFQLLGCGMALPGQPISTTELLWRLQNNLGLSTRTGASLARRLGVEHRHHSRDWQQRFEVPRPGNRNSDLASLALVDALAQAQLPIGKLQYLFGHTTTPARLLPPGISEVANNLGLEAPFVELRQACTGFANALQLAEAMLRAPDSAPVAIVGSETGSVFLDPEVLNADLDHWVSLLLMGDGAGAAVIGPDNGASGAYLETMFFGHLGLGRSPGFVLDEGGSDYPAVRDGRTSLMFRHNFDAVVRDGLDLFEAGLAAARSADVDTTALAAIVPHQANGHIGEWLSRALNLETLPFHGHANRFGNLGSASTWVSLCELRADPALRAGDRVLFLSAEVTQHLYGGFVYVHG